MSIIYYQPFIIWKQFFAEWSPPQSTVRARCSAILILILILTNDFKSESMSLSEHNLGLILKSNIRAILIIQMSENIPGTFIMDCFVLPGSHDTCNNVYHHTQTSDSGLSRGIMAAHNKGHGFASHLCNCCIQASISR